ncbi:MAG: rRNA maturation RNase YbeY [Rhabdochlamydiaceae bacterium]
MSVFNGQSNFSLKASSVRKLVAFVLDAKQVSCEEVSIYLVGKRKISSLHNDFFNDPSPTDCITFPIDQEFLGEVFVCPKVAQEYNPLKPHIETSLYIIHGILHLLGYDDIDKNKRKIMQKEQMRLLKLAIKHRCILEPFS